MENNRIERQHSDAKDLYKYLMESNEVTFATYIDGVYKKVLLLSVASYFEVKISSAIIEFAKVMSGSDQRLASLIEKKVISRQYHTLFVWDGKNTNSFFALFGEKTKNKTREFIDNNSEIKDAELNFLKLGNFRNLLVHKNFSEYDVNNTVDEIYKMYKSASKFVDYIESVLSKDFL
jgi:hypothetical protein